MEKVNTPGARPLRIALRRVTLAWLFGASWLNLTTGAVLTQCAKGMGLTPFGFGLLAAVPWLGALIQFPASYAVEKYGRRRAVFLWTGFPHRAMWLVIAAIPWIFPRAWWWPALLVLMIVASLTASWGNPAIMSWFADLIPPRIRGRYLSRRSQAGQLAAVFVVVASGFAMDWAAPQGAEVLRRTVSLLLALAAVFGMIDYGFLSSVRGPEAGPPDSALSVWQLIRHSLADRSFRRFLAFNFTLTLATGAIGQFIWLYMFNVAGMTNVRANILFVVLPLLVTFLSYPIWGRLVDRLGRKPVLFIASVLIVHGALPWAFITPDHWLLPYLAVLVCSASWPGVDMASFSILLGATQSQGGRRWGSAYIALNSFTVAIAGTLAGVMNGALAEALKDWHGTLFGHPMTYHFILFVVSALLRLAALGWVLGMHEPRAYSLRAAVGYITSDIYSGAQQVVTLPLRLVGWVGPRNEKDKSSR